LSNAHVHRMCTEKNAKEVVWIWTSSSVKLATIGVVNVQGMRKETLMWRNATISFDSTYHGYYYLQF
jgi:hypothetical protein